MSAAEDVRGEGETDEGADDVVEDAASTHDRRAMLKKAAVGFGAAGAAWAAPRIEGLSLKPDYAAAATVRGTFTFKRSPTGCPNPFLSAADDCWGACKCNPATTNHTIGGEPISITWAGKADIGGSGTATVNFSNMDPPHNANCRITGASGSVSCCLGSFRRNNLSPTQVQWDINNPGVGTSQGNDVTITIVC